MNNQCSAITKSNVRCTNECIGKSKHCLKHVDTAKKLYLNYKSLGECINNVDMNKIFNNINDKINYLSKYYKILHKTYNARLTHRKYAIAPECYDNGHNKQFALLKNKMTECEKIFGELNINLDDVLNSNKATKFKMFKPKSQLFQPLENNSWSNNIFECLMGDNKDWILPTKQITNNTKLIKNNNVEEISQIIDNTTLIDNTQLIKKINEQSDVNTIENIATKLKNKSKKFAEKRMKEIKKPTKQNKKKNKKKAKTKKNIIVAPQVIYEDDDEEYEEYDEDEEDDDECANCEKCREKYYRKIFQIEDRITRLIINMFNTNETYDIFVLFVAMIRLTKKLIAVDYFLNNFKPIKNPCGCFGYYDFTLFCKCNCMHNVNTTLQICESNKYNVLHYVYKMLIPDKKTLLPNNRIKPLILDIKKLYTIFGSGMIDIPVRLVWNKRDRRLAVEQEGNSPNQHDH
jgi:hypothetical protein